MSSTNLDNLVKIRKLKSEPPTKSEFENLIVTGRKKLTDAEVSALNPESRFELSYAAAHGLSLAALRYCGYRSTDRFIVFQALSSTTELTTAQIRVLADAHNKRNKSTYEGETDISEATIAAIITVARNLLEYLERQRLLT